MKHLYATEKCDIRKEGFVNTCVAFGRFDGVHKGHMEIAGKVVQIAKEQGITSLLMSFDNSDIENKCLTTEEEKAYIFEKAGLNVLVSFKCAKGLKTFSIETFVRNILIESLGAKVIVVGEDDDFTLIQKIASEKGVEVVMVKPHKEAGQIICDQSIREAFCGKDFKNVNELCGHPYIMMGQVVHGKALGRTVGMPTANLDIPEYKLTPPSGVYGTLVRIEGELFQGLTNIGRRPSVDDFNYVTVETFLLDFNKNIYGKKLVLEVYDFIRDVVKFRDLDEVQQQVQKDIVKIRSCLDGVMN